MNQSLTSLAQLVLCARRVGALLLLVSIARAPLVDAQGLPAEPITLADGRLTIGGEASVATAREDTGYFNYTDYSHTLLRTVRLDFTAAFRAGDHVAVLGDVRSENWGAARPYALYIRVRPWTNRAFDIQAGRIPPVFGGFARRTYGADNPVIGYPLAYQYLTSLRADALPASGDDLQRMRGRGWLTTYPIGNRAPDRGLPIANALRWDTGVQVRIGSQPLELSAAITTGTLSHPQVGDDNGGRQLAARLGLRPVVGLVIGISGARGPYLDSQLSHDLPGARIGRFVQRAIGLDAEYSRDYWLLRGEVIVNEWTVPTVGEPFIARPLRVSAVSAEGRYKVWPGVYAAARLDHLGFSEIDSSVGRVSWDAPVTRLEAGGGVYLRRNLLAKAGYQHNWRDGGRVRSLGLVAAQLSAWF